MNLAIIGKIVFGTSCVGASVLGTYFYLTREQYIDELKNDEIYIYTISSTVSDEINEQINTTEKEGQKNYKCTFDSKDIDCQISAVKDFGSETKTINWNELKIKGSDETLKKEKLKQQHNIYRVKVKNTIGNWSDGGKTIDIFSTKENSKKYSSLKGLFAVTHEDETDQYTKTEYFIVKTSSDDITVNSNKTYKCLTSETKTITESFTDECNVYDFSDSTGEQTNLNNLNFKKMTTTSVQMAKSKYYVIKLKEKKEASKVKFMKIQQNNTTINLEDKIIAAIYTTEKEDNVFILDKVNSK